MKALRAYMGRRFAAWVYPTGVKIIFDDGSETFGKPPSDPHFAQSAQYLGYGQDLYWHMVEHDLCHALVAEELGQKHSGALWAQAHGWTGGEMPESGLLEEKRLTAVQRLLNNLPIDDNSWAREGNADLRLRLDYLDLMIDNLRWTLRPHGVAMTRQWAGSLSP